MKSIREYFKEEVERYVQEHNNIIMEVIIKLKVVKE